MTIQELCQYFWRKMGFSAETNDLMTWHIFMSIFKRFQGKWANRILWSAWKSSVKAKYLLWRVIIQIKLLYLKGFYSFLWSIFRDTKPWHCIVFNVYSLYNDCTMRRAVAIWPFPILTNIYIDWNLLLVLTINIYVKIRNKIGRIIQPLIGGCTLCTWNSS